jgi:hypothetical protein
MWDEAAPVGHLWFPPDNSPVWEVNYDNDCEHGKLTTRDIGSLASSIQEHFRNQREANELLRWKDRLQYHVFDDPEMHGGGLHVMKPGGWLNCHLDYDVHPHVIQARRALNIVSFIHPEWEQGWGGELYFADPYGTPIVEFQPLPGRIVAFEVSDLSYHGVKPISTKAKNRITTAVYFLCNAGVQRFCDSEPRSRKRAMFLPTRRKADG